MFYHPKAVNIHFLEPDGFKKVCDVVALKDKTWRYKNINKDLMYSDHTSWVYAIVLGKSIVKIGETGVPLGIKNHDRTSTVRNSLLSLLIIDSGDCPIIQVPLTVTSAKVCLNTQTPILVRLVSGLRNARF